MKAIEYNAQESIFSLMDRGARLDARNSMGFTLLHKAVMFGDISLIKRLLNHGAYRESCMIDAQDHNGNTALHWAVERNDPIIINALLYHRVKPSIKNKFGMKPTSVCKSDCIRNKLVRLE